MEYIKRDASGNCFSLCPDGMSEHWKQLVDSGMSQRAAASEIHSILTLELGGTPAEELIPSESAIASMSRYRNGLRTDGKKQVRQTDAVEPQDLQVRQSDAAALQARIEELEALLRERDAEIEMLLAENAELKFELIVLKSDEEPKSRWIDQPSYPKRVVEVAGWDGWLAPVEEVKNGIEYVRPPGGALEPRSNYRRGR